MKEKLTFTDLELRISERVDKGYPVELSLERFPASHRGYLDPAQAEQFELMAHRPQELGEKLFKWLLSDNTIRDSWAKAWGQHSRRRIRLRIDPEIPELHKLPWELLRAESLDLAASENTPFSRYLPILHQPTNPIVTRPVRILVAVSNPSDLKTEWNLDPIDPEAEFERIREVVNGQPAEVVLLDPPCTLSQIEKALRRDRHHIVHLVCHGTFDEKQGRGSLLLENDEGACKRELEEQVAGMMTRLLSGDHPLRLMYLMSCETAKRSSGDAFRGMGPSLIQAGVPAVVAMQDKVPISTAQAFSSTFYRDLFDHGQVDLAVNRARSELISAHQPDGQKLPGYAIPCLFMRLHDGKLFGSRGRLGSEQSSEPFWPVLLDNIADGCCIPILGSKVNEGLLPDENEVARKLAQKFDYPFKDAHDPVRVAQHVSLIDRESLRRRYLRILKGDLAARFDHNGVDKKGLSALSLTELAEKLNWSTSVLEIEQKRTILHQLADLELPLYLTTNVDPLMVTALRARQKRARQIGPHWDLAEGNPQWLLEPPASPDEPVVFHLFGHDGDEEQRRNMVLSEDDHFEHLVRLSRDQSRLLPSDMVEALARNTYLLLGFDITDWSFRVLLQGLLKSIDRIDKISCHVAVQLEIEEAKDKENAEKYLNRYLGQHQASVYWGTSQQFVAELMERWRTYCEEEFGD